jgi:hypothetical protein
MVDAAMRLRIKKLLLGVLPRVANVTCENTYDGQGENTRLIGQRIILHVKCDPAARPDQ